MRTGLIFLMLVFITGCSSTSYNQTKQTAPETSKSTAGAEENSDDVILGKMEDDLALSL